MDINTKLSTFVFKEGWDDTPQYSDPEDEWSPDSQPEPTNEEIEVDAPNSVIEAMIKAEMHKDKKIKFVRRKK